MYFKVNVKSLVLEGIKQLHVKSSLYECPFLNEWRREALKQSFYGDSDMQMCHSLTHSGVDTLRN